MARRTRHRRPGLRAVLARFGIGDRKRALRLACISLVSLAVAGLAGLSALSNAARAQRPAFVERLTNDPVASLLTLQNQLSASPRRILDEDFAAAIRESLRHQALDPIPLRMLALRAEAHGRAPEAVQFARLAERTSRRDLVTQLILIEQAVQANNAPLALRHYDKALRTSGEARSILFPILSAAIADDLIRRAFLPYVRERVYWVSDFVEYSTVSGETGPRNTARLLIAAGAGAQEDLMRARAPLLIQTLVDRRETALAQQLVLQMPGLSPRFFQDVGFNANSTNGVYGLLAWTPESGGSSGVSFAAATDTDRLSARIFASSGTRTVLLRRVVALPPGQYYLSEHRSPVAGDGAPRAYWEMKCYGNTGLQPIWRGPSDRAVYNVTRAQGPLIPAGCMSQLLELNVAAVDGVQGLEFIIEDFALTR
jgi:hypothetical protein